MGKAIALADDDLDRMIGVPEAAARLGIHVDTARAWIRTGRWTREFPQLRIATVAGKQQVSLRRVVQTINELTSVAS